MDYLDEERHRLRYSKEYLSRKTGLSRTTLAHWLRGERVEMLVKCAKLMAMLDLTPVEIVNILGDADEGCALPPPPDLREKEKLG